jgi:hypothetical protein
MEFVLVNGRTPRPPSFCVLCCEPIGDSYLREIGTRLSYCNHNCYVDHCTDSALALENPRENPGPEDIPCYRRVEIC